MEMDGAPLYPTAPNSPAVQDRIPLHHFDELTNLTLHSVLIHGNLSFKQKLPDDLDAILDMLPSLQKVFLPAGRFQSDPNETPIERLVRKQLERPTFCPSLQDICHVRGMGLAKPGHARLKRSRGSRGTGVLEGTKIG